MKDTFLDNWLETIKRSFPSRTMPPVLAFSPQPFGWKLDVESHGKAKYRVELPGYPILGDGKSEPGLSGLQGALA